MKEPTGFEIELSSLLNRRSREGISNTPDFILARYMADCLVAFERASMDRERWYGIKSSPGRPVQDNRPADDGLCSYCGHPRNSSTCQRSHP